MRSNDAHEMGDSAPYAFVTHDFGKTLDEDRQRHYRPINGRARFVPTFATAISSISAPRKASGSRSTAARTGNRSRTICRPFRCTTFGCSRSTTISSSRRTAAPSTSWTTFGPCKSCSKPSQAGTRLFAPRDGYEWTLHENDEGTYTNYAADNPPYGVMITFYQKEPQKTAPALDILDAHGPRDPQRFGNAQNRRQGRTVHPKQSGAEPLHVGFQRQRPGEMEQARQAISSRPANGPGRPSRQPTRCV